MIFEHYAQVHNDTDGTATETHADYEITLEDSGRVLLVAYLTFSGGSTDTALEFVVETSADGSVWIPVLSLVADDEQGSDFGDVGGLVGGLLRYVRGRTIVAGTAPSAITTRYAIGAEVPFSVSEVT